MRRIAHLIPAVVVFVACAKSEKPPADTAAAITPAPAASPAAPTAVSEADIAGTWTGTSSIAGSDSVLSNWTQVCAAGACKGTSKESKTTTHSSYTLAGDSAVGVTQPFSDPQMMKGQKLVDHWVAHINGTNVTGTGMFTLAAKADSTVMRYTFKGSKKQ